MSTLRLASLVLILALGTTLAASAQAAPPPSGSRALAARARWGVLAEPGMSLGTFTRLRLKAVGPLIQEMHARNQHAFEVDSRAVPRAVLAVPYGIMTIVGVGGHAALAGYDIVKEAVGGLRGTSRR